MGRFQSRRFENKRTSPFHKLFGIKKMTFLGQIFRCMLRYCHLVDCVYWAFIASNTLYCKSKLKTNIAQGKENYAPKNVADILKSYGAWHGQRLQEANLWNLMTGLASVNNPRSYQTTKNLISDIAIV